MAKFEYGKFLDLLLEFHFPEFEWDSGNVTKSIQKHNIEAAEAEEAFYDDEMLVLGKQTSPKTSESRFGIISKGISGRILFISFTIRDSRIRVISARAENKAEKDLYEK
jgi:uncharacterized DUF497 family protein